MLYLCNLHSMYSVYIIRCKDGSLYTGISTDVERRFLEHQKGRGARYTKMHGVDKIVYVRKCGAVGKALKREAKIKTWPRERKLRLVKEKPYGKK